MNEQITGSDAYFMSTQVINPRMPSSEDILGFLAGSCEVIAQVVARSCVLAQHAVAVWMLSGDQTFCF